jgi:hypothetical protein
MKESIKKVHTFKLKVSVSQADIEEGECRKPSRCMEKLAVERALEKMFPNARGSHHVKVHAGATFFNVSGYRWMCVQHRIAKAALIQFDMKRTVSPHSYTLEAQRKSKIQATTSERRKQINAARHARIAAGRPDKSYTMHDRVVGYA